MTTYDAFLLVSFGGPERPEDVLPFLAQVTRGRGIPPERLEIVAEHYRDLGGSPINDQCRQLLAALRSACAAEGMTQPWYWGNRNWHPTLTETVAQMRVDGVRRALAFVTSPYGSYSGCRQYLDDIASAVASTGEDDLVIDKIRQFHDHPGFIEAHADAVRAALARVPGSESVRLVFTAHSIPVSAAASSGPGGNRYPAQIAETARLVATAAGGGVPWDLVWQSRSGPASVPWLAPDINDHLADLATRGVTAAVVVPIGFLSDNVEVLWDLDREAAATAERLGIRMVRAATPGTARTFVEMIVELIGERLDPDRPKRGIGELTTWDRCGVRCCPPPVRR